MDGCSLSAPQIDMTDAMAAARRRLLRDMGEICAEPLETITAALVDDSDIFHWCANVRAAQFTEDAKR